MKKFLPCLAALLFLPFIHAGAQTQGVPVSSSKSAVISGSATVSSDTSGVKSSPAKGETPGGSASSAVSTEPVVPQSAEKKKPK